MIKETVEFFNQMLNESKIKMTKNCFPQKKRLEKGC